MLLGEVDGNVEGKELGLLDGTVDGPLDGDTEGKILGLPDGIFDGRVDGNIDGLELGGNDTSTLQQSVEQVGGQQSPVRPNVAHPGFAEHAAEPAAIEGPDDLEGTLLGIVDGVLDGDVDGDVDGVADGEEFGVTEGGAVALEEQQFRNVTPSDVGQQSPAKLEHSGCAEQAADTVPTDGAEDLDGPLLGIADGAVDGDVDGVADGEEFGVTEGGAVALDAQQLRKVTPSDVGQQSPAKLEHSGCAEQAETKFSCAPVGALLKVGVVLGASEGVLVSAGAVFGEQQLRKVTPSDVGQQSPAKLEHPGCAEHAAW
ncbi:MAG: hypothetical protein SGBAC_006412 [Bacillariaceae sp.]